MKAFPHSLYEGVNNFEWGMDLRDYFAAKAMQSMISQIADWKYAPNSISKLAYEQADAMMKARKNAAT